MIIAKYGNSVNITDDLLDQAITSTRQLIDRNESLIAATIYGTPIDARVTEVDLHRESGNANYRNVWHWVKRMRNGILDRTSTESFRTEFEAALAAERIADACGAPLSEQVQLQLSRQVVVGYEKRLFGKPLESCDNQHQHRGYQERIVEELREAVEREAAAVEIDAQHWPPDDDEPTEDQKWHYYMQYEEDYDSDPCGVYGGWGQMA